MQKQRIDLKVTVDLDPVPGTFHTPENVERVIHGILNEMIPHYNPEVNNLNIEV